MEVWKIKEISSIDIYENPSEGRGRKKWTQDIVWS